MVKTNRQGDFCWFHFFVFFEAGEVRELAIKLLLDLYKVRS